VGKGGGHTVRARGGQHGIRTRACAAGKTLGMTDRQTDARSVHYSKINNYLYVLLHFHKHSMSTTKTNHILSLYKIYNFRVYVNSAVGKSSTSLLTWVKAGRVHLCRVAGSM